MKEHNEVILETDDVRVRIMVLECGQATEWHYHTEVADRMLCLEGELAVEFEKSQERVVMTPGGRCEVTVRHVHRVVNLSTGVAKYLLVQGVGRYDFNAVAESDLCRMTGP